MEENKGARTGAATGGRKLERFEDLSVGQKAHELVLMVYRMSARFPREEQFGLVPQMRQCGSISSVAFIGWPQASHWSPRVLGVWQKGQVPST